MAENRAYFKITKTCVGSVRFLVESQDHTTREIYLDDKRSFYNLPADWAVGVFRNPDTYNMYKLGYFTFDYPEEIARLAIEKGEYFEDPNLVPRSENYIEEMLKVLKSGSKAQIENLCAKENSMNLVGLIREHYSELSTGTIKIIEQNLGIDLSEIVEE